MLVKSAPNVLVVWGFYAFSMHFHYFDCGSLPVLSNCPIVYLSNHQILFDFKQQHQTNLHIIDFLHALSTTKLYIYFLPILLFKCLGNYFLILLYKYSMHVPTKSTKSIAKLFYGFHGTSQHRIWTFIFDFAFWPISIIQRLVLSKQHMLVSFFKSKFVFHQVLKMNIKIPWKTYQIWEV